MGQSLAVLGALAPIFVLILLGHLARRLRFVPDGFWPPAEKLTYYVFFPALIVDNLARATFKDPAGNILSVIQA